jgi:DNA polymerase
MSLVWDWETRSEIDIKSRGAYVYAQHPSTIALLASFKLKFDLPWTQASAAVRAWAASGGPLNTICRWRRGETCPPYVRAYVEAGGEIEAWNATFERLIWWNVMVPRHGWPRPAMERFRCTAVTAAAMSMPRDLERCGEALGLKIQKDKRGKALMKIHSIPTGFNEDGSAIWHPLIDDPTSMDAYHDYCDFDVLSEEEAAERLIPLNDYEMRVYWLNERINDKGLRIDTVSARAALRLIAKAKDKINEELAAVTGNAVTAVTQAARLKAWCEAQGVAMPSMDKDDVDEFLHSDRCVEGSAVQRALELRAEGAKPSVDKISAMLGRVGTDGRARGVYLHHGAGQTGRFSSRGVQAHNMPKYRKIFQDAHINQDTLFKAIRSEDPEVLTELYGAELGRPLHLLSDAVRGFIWAAPKHEFLVADYSSIEGRLAAWFAGEAWKIEAYRALDRGEGHGIYELTAAGIYNVDVKTVDKSQRQTGKVAELAYGYMGGVGSTRKFARQHKIALGKLINALWAATELDAREYAEKRFSERLKASDEHAIALGRDGWISAELMKTKWRAKHPMIVAMWKALEQAATNAVANPGQKFYVTRPSGPFDRLRTPACTYLVKQGFLWCLLPSGRPLAYGAPKMQMTEAPWADKTLDEVKREQKMSLTVRGVDAQSERWVRFPVYGGSLFNNLVQGTARDILVDGLFKTEQRYGTPSLHTHDEIGVEVLRSSAEIAEYETLLAEMPEWAVGLPMSSKAFLSKRYKKD